MPIMSNRQGRCPHCRRVVLFNDETSTISHQAPLCPEFAKMMEDAVAAGSAICDGMSTQTYDDNSN